MNIELELRNDRCICRFTDEKNDIKTCLFEGDNLYFNKYPEGLERVCFVSFEKVEEFKEV